MLVKKEIIRPGTYFYVDQDSGLPRKLVVTRDGVNHLLQTGNQMLAAGLSIPVPLEHQPDARPVTAAEKAAKQLLNNAGWVSKYELQGDILFGILDIPDPSIAKKLPTTIRWTSPWISSFTDGTGKQWNGVISHVALTSRPRIHKQAPFPNIAAAMSYALNTAEQKLDQVKSCAISRAGLLLTDGAALKPAYPMAFSIWGGIGLAHEEVMAGSPTSGQAIAEGEPPPEGAPPPNGMPPGEKSLIDPDGDIDIETVLSGLLSAAGIAMPENGSKESFMLDAYKSLMEYIKSKSGRGAGMNEQMPNQSPYGDRNDLPMNPVIQEQQPMYMSMEQINAIADPTTKQIALSLHQQQAKTAALEKQAFERAKGERDRRIAALLKRKPADTALREKVLAHAAGCGFSLGNDGTVKDAMAPMLEILEQGIQDMPTLLKGTQTGFTEQPHPPMGGEMPEERRKQVADGMAKMAGAR